MAVVVVVGGGGGDADIGFIIPLVRHSFSVLPRLLLSLHRPEYLELMSSIRERQCPFHEALPVHRHCALGDARQLTDVLCDMYSYIYYEPERLEPPTPKVPADHELELEESWQAKLREFRTQKPPLAQCATAPAAYQWTPTAVGEQVAFTDFDVYSDGEDDEDQVVDFFAR
jgi:hypothetical protein